MNRADAWQQVPGRGNPRRWVARAALACAAVLPAWVGAADAVTDALQAAYAPYRAALFRTNSKAQAEAEQAIAAARAQWRTLTERHGAKPGAPYDRDAAFAATLKQVDEVYARAEAQIAARQLPEAHETLEKARDLLSELRRRNNVVVFSDHMNAYHAQMEHVLVDGPKVLRQPGGLLELAAQAGTLDYLAKRLRAEAPAALAQDGEFRGLAEAVEASVHALRAAIAKQDEAAVREALGKLKQPYSRLFLKFG